jgi:hypothetical protein
MNAIAAKAAPSEARLEALKPYAMIGQQIMAAAEIAITI